MKLKKNCNAGKVLWYVMQNLSTCRCLLMINQWNVIENEEKCTKKIWESMKINGKLNKKECKCI